MKQHLRFCLAIAIAALTGCRAPAPRPPQPTVGMITSQGFIKQWQADFTSFNDPIASLDYLPSKDLLVAYTRSNNSYWLTASSGVPLSTVQVAPTGHTAYPPVAFPDDKDPRIVVATTTSIEIFNSDGHRLTSLKAPRVIGSPVIADRNALYAGVATPQSGRLGKIVIAENNASARIDWEVYAGEGIIASPTLAVDGIYAAALDGTVFGMNRSGQPLWTIAGSVFKTDAPVSADVRADDDGVYIASQDQKLYCLERNTGKIKWSYYAGIALFKPGTIVGNLYLQPVGTHALVAINKTQGDFVRKPVWKSMAGQQVIMADDDYIYVSDGRGTINALVKGTGELAFHSRRNDLTVFADAAKTPLIYAATEHGSILAIKPITKPGTPGEFVRGDTNPDWVAVNPQIGG